MLKKLNIVWYNIDKESLKKVGLKYLLKVLGTSHRMNSKYVKSIYMYITVKVYSSEKSCVSRKVKKKISISDNLNSCDENSKVQLNAIEIMKCYFKCHICIVC